MVKVVTPVALCFVPELDEDSRFGDSVDDKELCEPVWDPDADEVLGTD